MYMWKKIYILGVGLVQPRMAPKRDRSRSRSVDRFIAQLADEVAAVPYNFVTVKIHGIDEEENRFVATCRNVPTTEKVGVIARSYDRLQLSDGVVFHLRPSGVALDRSITWATYISTDSTVASAVVDVDARY